jgi:hypothetical protein
MPPKKGDRGAKKGTGSSTGKEKTPAQAPALPPLNGCIIALSGTFPGQSQSALERDFINALGASLVKTVNDSTTHLVTTDIDLAKPSAKVKQAQSHDARIVKLAWLEDCLEQGMRLSENAYTFDAPDSVPDPPTVIVNGKAHGSRKRTDDDAEDDDSQSQPQPKKRSKTKTDADADMSLPQPKTMSKAASTDGSKKQSQEPLRLLLLKQSNRNRRLPSSQNWRQKLRMARPISPNPQTSISLLMRPVLSPTIGSTLTTMESFTTHPSTKPMPVTTITSSIAFMFERNPSFHYSSV